jgi:hypothetical protein
MILYQQLKVKKENMMVKVVSNIIKEVLGEVEDKEKEVKMILKEDTIQEVEPGEDNL